MKKKLFAIASVIIMAGTISFVACDKNNESSQTISSSFSNMKGRATADNLLNALVSYFTVCDSAYHSDSTTFLSVCANSDTTNFLKVTGISSELLSAYRSLALQELEDFVKDNPNFKPDENSCTSCSYNALPRLGYLATATSGNLTALIPSSPKEYDYYAIFNAISCYKDLPDVHFATCICAQIGDYFKETKKESLNTELIVAKLDSHELYDGEELPLTFDEEQFKARYEEAMKNKSGDKWVAEEVKVYMHNLENKLIPILKVSAYNVDRESASTLFIIAKAAVEGNKTVSVIGRSDEHVVCEASGLCSTTPNAGCDITKDILGNVDCTECLTPGNCKKTGNSSTYLFAVCDIIFGLIR